MPLSVLAHVDFVAVRSPANIEGALESGFRAAAEVGALLDAE